MRATNALAVLCAIGLAAAPAAAFDPPVATDINPDPNIVEVNLTAAETTWQFIQGIDTTVYAYNGSIPGPTIQAELGNTVIVHFTNNLPEPTTIHWHGIDVPATMDGSHISQLWVQPGETFDYQFVVNRASLFWYHPHVRTFDQVEKGLYGGVIVHDPVKDAELGFDDIEEHIVFFDDILLDANFEIVPAFSFTDPLQNAEYHVNGREGNHLLVNGKVSDESSLTVPNGEPQRWRVVNAANTTFARLGIEELGVDLYWVGSDAGLLDDSMIRRPIEGFSPDASQEPVPLHPTSLLLRKSLEGVFLMPGERIEVIFTPSGADAESFTVWHHDWLRGRHVAVYDAENNIILLDDPLDGFYPDQPYLELVLSGTDPGTGPFVPPTDLTTIPLPTNSEGVLPVTFGHGDPDPQGNITLFAQADFSTGTMVPLPEAKIDSFNAHDVDVGEVWTWEVTNLTHGDHPFHTHGFPFIPLEVEFTDMDDPGSNFVAPYPFVHLKDTIRAPARGGAKGRSTTILRAITLFDDTDREGDTAAQGRRPTFRPDGSFVSGGWLFHCHVLEHSAKGMLSFYEVHDPADPFVLLGKHLDGVTGKPSLTATGDLSPGSAVVFELVNAAPNADFIVIGSTTAARQQIFGGEFVPANQKQWRGTTDANGRMTLSITAWNNLASGKTAYFQVGIKDAAGPQGWAFSNALSFTKP